MPLQSEQEKISQCMSDKMCLDLSEVIYFEARSEPVEGMVAVAFVVLNRINHPKRWGNTVDGVITQRDQFTYRWDGSMRRGFSELKAYRKVLTVAHDTLAGELNNPIGSADHYKTLDARPNWNYNKLIQVAVIGNHVFYQHK